MQVPLASRDSNGRRSIMKKLLYCMITPLIFSSPLISIEEPYCGVATPETSPCADYTFSIRFDENNSSELRKGFSVGDEIRITVYFDSQIPVTFGVENCDQPPDFNVNACGFPEPTVRILGRQLRRPRSGRSRLRASDGRRWCDDQPPYLSWSERAPRRTRRRVPPRTCDPD